MKFTRSISINFLAVGALAAPTPGLTSLGSLSLSRRPFLAKLSECHIEPPVQTAMFKLHLKYEAFNLNYFGAYRCES